MSEEKNYLEILQEKISNPIWLNEQEPEFAEALKTIVESFKESARQNILMVNLFNEYGYAMNAIFDTTTIANQEPTQTIPEPEPANRAERRASKRRTPLNLAE
jgi:hypothetical protein